MRHSNVALAAAFGLVLVAGCSSKQEPVVPDEDTGGTTEGMRPDDVRTERVEPDPPTTPGLGDDSMSGADLGERIELTDIYFDFDSYEIRADQRATLEANSRALLRRSGWKIIVEGHCDERGTEEYNLALGDRRATKTSEYLNTLGVTRDRISTISYGKAYPVDPGQSERAWALNRRSHFVLVAPGY